MKNKRIKEKMKKASDRSFFIEYLLHQWNEAPDTCENKKAEKRIWQEIHAKCRNQQSIDRYRWRFGYLKTVAASAAVLLIILGGYWLLKRDHQEIITHTAWEDKICVVLPDSSIVWLNANSKIQYLSGFSEKREIQLDGEGFFDVKRNGGSPFIVSFQDALVEVKGTTFNINSGRNKPAEVTLLTGEIEFSTPLNEKTVLKPFERIIYDKNKQTATLEQNITETYDWRTGIYKFRDKRLDELIVEINKIYGSDIIFKDPEHGCTLFSGSIRKEETLIDVIEKLCITLNLKYQTENEKIVFY